MSEPKANQPKASKPKALIVEDDTLLGQIFCKTLEESFEVSLVANGAQALALIESTPANEAPLLLVLDINLPGVSGLKIYERLAARRQTEPELAHMQVIVCSADTQATQFLQDDVDLTLLKPVSPLQLRTLAARMLAQARE